MPIDDKATTINALIDSVEAIEIELGLLPSGVYASVRTRLDILEARINNPLAPAPDVENPFFIGNTGVTISTGVGSPTENRVFGSLYLREDGYNIQGLYAFRPDGYWHQIDTDPWTAAGDLSGNSYSQTVIGLQGRPVSSALPIIDSAGDGYVLTWGADGYWEPQIGFFAAGDLTGNKINQKVSFLQGTTLNIGTPTDGYVLTWDGTHSQWNPQRAAVIFDPLDNNTSTNIRSNRFATQSPIDHTKIGIVNFGSDSNQSTTGVNVNYSSVLGGDQNSVSGTYSSIVGGLTNSTTGQYSFVGGGQGNTVSSQYATIGGGTINVNQATYGIIGGGSNNRITGTSWHFIGGGAGNVVSGAHYSSIVGGNTNTISSNYSTINGGSFNAITTDYGFIGGGSNNQINAVNAAVLTGTNNNVSGVESLIIGGDNNVVNAVSSSVVNGSHNTINSTGNYSTVIGTANTVSDGYALVSGVSNNIHSGTNMFVTVNGDNNSAFSGSNYSTIWGSGNQTHDGYLAVYGLTNTVNAGGTYSSINGSTNQISSSYSSIWGNNNTIFGSSNYSAIFGFNNSSQVGSTSAFISGNNNSITAPYSSAWGTNITLSGTDYLNAWGSSLTITPTSSYSSTSGSNLALSGNWSNIWGNHSTITTSDYTNVFGYYHTAISAPGSLVHGQYGKAINPGQYAHSNNSFNGTTAGTGQFSRLVMTGTGTTGAAITLTVDGSAAPVLEDGKSYDMFAKIDVTQTTGTTGVCARYTFDVLAHQESSTVTIDRVNTYLVSDNGTSWVGNNWTSIFTAGTTTITSGSNGQALPQSVIQVASVAQFPSSGTIYVLSSTGFQAVQYTGTTTSPSPRFTGCTIAYSAQYGGSLGTMATGNEVYTLTGTTFSVILPSSGSQTRRAVASLEWREVTRL